MKKQERKNLRRGRDKHGEAEFQPKKEPLGPLSCCWGSLFIHICLSLIATVLCFELPIWKLYLTFFPINTIRDIPIGQKKIKKWSKVHHFLSEILFLWWCVIGNQKDYLKLLSSNCFRASLQRGTHVMFSSPHRHTQPRESQTVIISKQSERNEKGFLFLFRFSWERTENSICHIFPSVSQLRSRSQLPWAEVLKKGNKGNCGGVSI